MSSRSRFAGRAVAGTICLAVIAGALIWTGYTGIAGRHVGQAEASTTAPASAGRYLGVYEPGAPDSYDQVGSFASASWNRAENRRLLQRLGRVIRRRVRLAGAEAGCDCACAATARARSSRCCRRRPGGRLLALVRATGPQFRASGHHQLRARDERAVVFLGAGTRTADVVRCRLAPHGHPIPCAGSHERDMAMGRELRARQAASGRPVVARKRLRHLGWPRLLLCATVRHILQYLRSDDHVHSQGYEQACPDRRDRSRPSSGKQREAQIRSLFAGTATDHLLGFVWFDEKQDDGPYHQDWRLEDAPAALAVFKAAAKRYG